jgi:hypothetical protein
MTAARPALGYRSLETPGNRRPRQMVTVPQGTQNPAYGPLSAHKPDRRSRAGVKRPDGTNREHPTLQQAQGTFPIVRAADRG